MLERLDALRPAAPWRTAGGGAFGWVALLRPLDAADTPSIVPGVRLWRPRGAQIDVDALAASAPIDRAPRAALGDHLLVLLPDGAFLASDRAALANISCGDAWQLAWRIDRKENLNLDPAPAVLCIALELRSAELPQRLVFEFTLRADRGAAPVNGVAPLGLTLV